MWGISPLSRAYQPISSIRFVLPVHVHTWPSLLNLVAASFSQLEEEAMHSFMQEMLGGEGNKEARERIWALWVVSLALFHNHSTPDADSTCRDLQEYEARETPESKLVKDLDRLELILQAVEYERCESVVGSAESW